MLKSLGQNTDFFLHGDRKTNKRRDQRKAGRKEYGKMDGRTVGGIVNGWLVSRKKIGDALREYNTAAASPGK